MGRLGPFAKPTLNIPITFRWCSRPFGGGAGWNKNRPHAKKPDPLLHLTGLLQFGPPRGNVISGILASAERHGLAIERLAPDETTRRFPAFRVPDDAACVFESEAGFLRVEHCVRAFLRQAQASGGQTLSATCHSWRETPRGVVVETSVGRVEADQLVMTAGPWSPALLEDAVPRIVVLAKHLHWFPCPNENFRPDAGMPVFLAERPSGVFYGFPQWEGRCKLAEHSGGTPVDVDLDHVRRDVDPDDLRRVQAFGRDCLVDLPMESPVDHTVCFYSLSNDGHFYLGTLPGRTRVHVAAGLSGHGFKFAPVLGQALAELALDGKNRPTHRIPESRPPFRR